MNFLSPTGLWAFAFGVPIVLLFILRLRLRRHEVPTLMFWNIVLKEKESTALFQRLKQWLALLLALLFMALLALALGQPQLAFLATRARDVVLVIDNSASMSATDVEPSRLEAAKREAVGLVRRLRHSDRMMVVSCSNRPVVEIPFTGHHRSLIEAIEGIEPTEVPTDLRGAVELAHSITHPQRRVERLVISDGTAPLESPKRESDAAAVEPDEPPPDMHVLVVGERCDNVGIVTLSVRQGLVSRLDYQVLLAVKNFSDEAREFNVDLSLDGELFDSIPYTVGPGELSRKTYANVSTAGGRITAVIDRPDDLAADNAAYAILPEQRLVRVCLVTDGNLFLEQALASETSVVLTTVAPADYNRTAEFDVTIFDRCLPAEPGDGNFIVVFPPREGDGLPWTIGEDLDEVLITDVAESSPILAYVELGQVLIGEAYAVEAPAGANVLVSSFEHPLVLLESRPGRNVLFFAFDVNRSDLPLRVAFPIIVANSIAWFTQPKGMPERGVHTGETLRLDVAGIDDRAFTITGPEGKPIPVRREGDSVVFSATDTAGFYEITGETLDSVAAVSLASERESDITPHDDVDGAGSLPGWSVSALQFPFWYYLLLLAVVLSVAEWIMYQRRVVQ